MCRTELSTERSNEPGLECYLQTMLKYAPLTRAEEIELLRAIRNGAREPLDRLIEAHFVRVVDIAREHLGGGLGLLDLIAEGTLGLISAARRFDADRFASFAPFAEIRIHQTMLRAIHEAT